MTKVRVFELAKELNITSKELMEKIEELDIVVKSHMSSIGNEEAELIKELLTENAKEVVKEEVNKEVKEEVEEVIQAEEIAEVENTEHKKRGNKKKSKQKNIHQATIKNEPQKKGDGLIIDIENNIVVRDLAEKLGVNASQIISKLIGLGVMATQNQAIDAEVAAIVADEFGFSVNVIQPQEEEDEFELDYEDDPKDLQYRPPVVTVMGHVDHGKTSLLDAIRHTNVTRGEAGGITQHIGASTVNINGKKIVFLDTPGHEAFTAMRARGAQVTDISVLVVAADDGVMPQTIEAIAHSKAAKVPIIVAINKIDKPTADLDRIKQELAENGLVPEDWGGDTITVPVSAKQMIGIEDILEMILLVAEMQELKANPNREAIGTIVEAQLDKGRGPVATVLVQKGTLKVGDMVVTGTSSGRIRAMFDDKGKKVKKAGPSIPVLILGLSEVPKSGDLLFAVEDEKKARSIADAKKNQIRESMIVSNKVSLDDLFERIKQGEIKDLNLVIKGDGRGSIEALASSLEKLDTEEVRINIIHMGVGGITESDVILASASNAIVIGFNVRPNLNAIDVAKSEEVDIRTYRVIYEAIEDIQAAVKGMHAPKIVEEVQGRAQIRQTFRLPNGNSIAGIYVLSGKIARNSKIRLLRNDVVVYDGSCSSLKRFKDDAKEVQTGYEAGMGLDNYNDLKEGDTIESYILKEVENI